MITEDEGNTHLLSRLFVYLLLGFAIFASIFAAQKVTTTPKPEPKLQATPILTPTPTAEEVIIEEEVDLSTVSGQVSPTIKP